MDKYKKLRKTKSNGNNSDENIVAIYLKEINKTPLLSREEEDYYAKKAVKGDPEARERLINANLRFVFNVAKKYRNKGLPFQDLISEGNIGLINAIKKYNVARGYHFITYAVWWIRQSILKAICEQPKEIRLPLGQAGLLNKVQQIEEYILSEKGYEPKTSEIAKILNTDEEKITRVLTMSQDPISLETKVYWENDINLLKEAIPDKEYRTEKSAMDKSLKEDINRVLETLSPREAQVIERRFGLNGKIPTSLKGLAEIFHLTKERMRQIEKKL